MLAKFAGQSANSNHPANAQNALNFAALVVRTQFFREIKFQMIVGFGARKVDVASIVAGMRSEGCECPIVINQAVCFSGQSTLSERRQTSLHS